MTNLGPILLFLTDHEVEDISLPTHLLAEYDCPHMTTEDRAPK